MGELTFFAMKTPPSFFDSRGRRLTKPLVLFLSRLLNKMDKTFFARGKEVPTLCKIHLKVRKTGNKLGLSWAKLSLAELMS